MIHYSGDKTIVVTDKNSLIEALKEVGNVNIHISRKWADNVNVFVLGDTSENTEEKETKINKPTIEAKIL